MKAFFVFSGQGAQTVGMGRDLYDSCPASKAVFDEADAVLGYKLSSVCFDGPAEKLTETAYCQVAIYTMSCAALAAFRAKFPGVEPTACAGLSLGEYGALFAAGAYSFADGLRLLNQRAHFMDKACKASDGAMASVIGGDASVIAAVAQECGIDVANYNCPGQIVISGLRANVEQASLALKDKGVRKVVPLPVAGAFHSRLMAPAGEELAAVLQNTAFQSCKVPVYHNYSASPAADASEIRIMLASQVAGSVRWEDCVRKMAAAGGDTMIEFGPGTVLTGLLRRTIKDMPYFNINSAASLDAFSV